MGTKIGAAVLALALSASSPPASAQISDRDQERVVHCFTEYPVGRRINCNGEAWYTCDGGAILETEYLKGGPLSAWSMNNRAYYYGKITNSDATWKIRAAIRKHKRDGTLFRHEPETFGCPPIS